MRRKTKDQQCSIHLNTQVSSSSFLALQCFILTPAHLNEPCGREVHLKGRLLRFQVQGLQGLMRWSPSVGVTMGRRLKVDGRWLCETNGYEWDMCLVSQIHQNTPNTYWYFMIFHHFCCVWVNFYIAESLMKRQHRPLCGEASMAPLPAGSDSVVSAPARCPAKGNATRGSGKVEHGDGAMGFNGI